VLTSTDKWLSIACDQDLKITDILAVKNLDIDIQVNDSVSKLVQSDHISRFLDFTVSLKNEKVLFGYEIGIVERDHSTTIMKFGGTEYQDKYMITAYSNCFEMYDELMVINNDQTNMLRRKIQELESANSTKDRLFSIIGHDLRTPLSNIIESISIIASNKYAYEELSEFKLFDQLKDSTGNALMLLENLLEWSKCQLGEMNFSPSCFDLAEVIRTDISILDSLASAKNIHISKVLCQKPQVYADSRMVGCILRNLLSNAIKFSNAGDEVMIKVDVEQQYAKISIIDHGIGIPKEKFDGIFACNNKKIIRGTQGEKGTGFGLLLCKKLVELNGGKLCVSSEIGKGSEFTFTIPLVAVIGL